MKSCFRYPAVTFFTLSLLFGAVTLPRPVWARGDAVAIGKYEDWHELDEVEIVQVFRLGDYRSIVVAPVDPRGAELPDKGDNTYEPTLKVLAGLTGTVTSGLKDKVPAGVTVSQGANGGGAGALVVRSKVTFILPGSAAARHFGGLAGAIAGASRIGLAGEVVDGRTNKVLFRFRTKRASGAGGGLFSGDYAQLMNRSAKEIGGDLAGAIAAFR